MRRLLVALLLGFTGCTSIDEPAPVAALEQANSGFADLGPGWVGMNTQAHLGSVISTCPGSGFLAGAPGDDSVGFLPQGTRVSLMRTGVLSSYPVICMGTGFSLGGIVGGPFAARVSSGGAVGPLPTPPVESLALAVNDWVAVGEPDAGVVALFAPIAATALSSPSYTSPAIAGNGAAVAWHSASMLVVANSQSHSVALWPLSSSPDGGVTRGTPVPLLNPDQTYPSSDFGAVLAVGNVALSTGEEIIVAAPAIGRVYVYSASGVLQLTLSASNSFGASLEVDPRPFAGSLHALWVGEPRLDRVHAFLGDAGTAFDAPASADGGLFGAAIAIDSTGMLAIGAPRYSQNLGDEVGAVYSFTIDGGLLPGVVGQCTAGGDCVLPNCTSGVCLGGVLCTPVGDAGSACLATKTCVNHACVFPDAGVPDAGVPDAGVPDAGVRDAGTPDAGVRDAGTPDAGARDAGTTDAGARDAGTTDAGVTDTDAGIADAGSGGGDDAGLDDAGTADAGTADAGTNETITFRSCGCSTGGLPMLLLALALGLRRRP